MTLPKTRGGGTVENQTYFQLLTEKKYRTVLMTLYKCKGLMQDTLYYCMSTPQLTADVL